MRRMACPKCRGRGTIYYHIGRAHDTTPFSPQHLEEAKVDVAERNAGEISSLAEFGYWAICQTCNGSGIIRFIPQGITKAVLRSDR